MLPSFSLPPLECCFGTSPIQAEKSRPDRNAFGSAMLATRAVASAGPTPGISSSRRLVSLERCQAMIRRSNSKILAFQGLQLGAESGNTCPCNLGQSFVAFISDDLQQLFDTMASDRCDNPKLGKMGANGIDHRGLLADEQVPGTVQRQAALLPWRFGRHEPHVRPADRLTDRLGISGIVLMPLHIGLHVGRRHQAHGVAKGLKFARPMMRRGASFDTNQARRHLLEESQNVVKKTPATSRSAGAFPLFRHRYSKGTSMPDSINPQSSSPSRPR